MQTMLFISPQSLQITGLGNTVSFSVDDFDAAYDGFYIASSEDSAVATVRQGSGANAFIVTSIAVGSTFVDVSTADGGFIREPVSVSNSGIIVEGKARP